MDMTKIQKVLLYLMAFMYAGLGVYHFISPEKYLPLFPAWIPAQLALVYVSGFAEIVLGILVAVKNTRRIAAALIIAMLIVFLLLIHIPHTIDLYRAGKQTNFIINLLRIPIQFLLIAWAWVYYRWPAER
jgi:uncharacterized membrane protein